MMQYLMLITVKSVTLGKIIIFISAYCYKVFYNLFIGIMSYREKNYIGMFLKYLHYSWKKRLKLHGLRAKGLELTSSLIVGIPHFTLQCHRSSQKKRILRVFFAFDPESLCERTIYKLKGRSRHIKKLCKEAVWSKNSSNKKKTLII